MDIDLGKILNSPEAQPFGLPKEPDKPRPTRAWAHLSSGVIVECDVQWAGFLPNGDRRYRLVAEIDWATANVLRFDVDRWPRDVQVTIAVPEEWDNATCISFGRRIEWMVAGAPYDPRSIERTND